MNQLFERLVSFGLIMSLHSATWRAHASELDDSLLIQESIKWIAGENAIINIENGKSERTCS